MLSDGVFVLQVYTYLTKYESATLYAEKSRISTVHKVNFIKACSLGKILLRKFNFWNKAVDKLDQL